MVSVMIRNVGSRERAAGALTLALILSCVLAGELGARNENQQQLQRAWQILAKALGLVSPGDIDTLIEIGKLQYNANDAPGGKATFMRAMELAQTLPLYDKSLLVKKPVLLAERSHYFILIADAQRETGDRTLASKALGLALDRMIDVKQSYRRRTLMEQLLISQVKLGFQPDLNAAWKLLYDRDDIVGDPTGEKVDALVAVAQAYIEQGNKEEATHLIAKALEQSGMIEEKKRTATLASIVQLLITLGRRAQADKVLHQEFRRLDVMEQTSGKQSRTAKILFLSKMAEAFAEVGDKESSRAKLMESLELARGFKAEEVNERASALRNIASAMVRLGDLDGALALEDQIQDSQFGDKGQSLPAIAEEKARRGDWAGALKVAERIGKRDPPRRADVLERIGTAKASAGDIQGALEIASKIGYPFRAGVLSAVAAAMVRVRPLDEVLLWAESQEHSYYRTYALIGTARGILADQET